jgi:hypothetical protein
LAAIAGLIFGVHQRAHRDVLEPAIFPTDIRGPSTELLAFEHANDRAGMSRVIGAANVVTDFQLGAQMAHEKKVTGFLETRHPAKSGF